MADNNDLMQLLQSLLLSGNLGQGTTASDTTSPHRENRSGGKDDINNKNDSESGEENEGNSYENFGGSFGGMDFSNIDINLILKLSEIMETFSKEDKNTQLLHSLKPHLSPERRKKVDSAVNIMRLIAIFPLLKECGLFKNGLF